MTRRAEGTYKFEKRDFIDVFLEEIDNHAHDKSENNHYTGKQHGIERIHKKLSAFYDASRI